MASLLMNASHHHSTPNLMSSSGSSAGGGSSAAGHGGAGVTGSSSVHDTLAAIVVPNELKTLIRLIMRIFYSFELYLCIEMLLIYPCLKEEDLAELLRLDLKTVHQYLVNLKKEKFLKEQQKMEKLPDGKFSPHSFFHIDYKMLVNVIKYKLDRIRNLIEQAENQSTTRPQFKCSECGKTYSDLDTKDIFLTMRCTLCNAEVEEDVESLPKQSARNLMNKFNTQMKPIFDLLSRVEHIRLADCVLRPEPVDMSYVLERMRTSSASGSAAGQNGLKPGANGVNGKTAAKQYGDRWSGDKTRNTDLFSKTQISVNLDAGESNATAKRAAKELPSIIVQNRVRDEELDSRDSILLNSVRQAADETINNSVVDASSAFAKPNPPSNTSALSTATGVGSTLSSSTVGSAGDAGSALTAASSVGQSTQNLEMVIMQKLLKHEKKASQPGSSSAESPGTDSSSTSNSPKTMPDPVSSITITKKRPMMDSVDSTKPAMNSNGELKNGFYKNGVSGRTTNMEENDLYLKKRKLNNGEIMNGNHFNRHHVSSLYLKRNHSDGSGSENSSETGNDDYYSSYNSGGDDDETTEFTNNGLLHPEDDNHYAPDEDDEYIPRVYVQNRAIRFDRITPRLIKLMAPNERDEYINICKQLYTEIYEI